MAVAAVASLMVLDLAGRFTLGKCPPGREVVRVVLPAQFVEGFFKTLRIDVENFGKTEDFEIVLVHVENELPHPQDPLAFGLLKVNPEPITEFT